MYFVQVIVSFQVERRRRTMPAQRVSSMKAMKNRIHAKTSCIGLTTRRTHSCISLPISLVYLSMSNYILHVGTLSFVHLGLENKCCVRHVANEAWHR